METEQSQAQTVVQTIDDVRQVLSSHRTELEQRKVKKLYLFGSMARGEPTDESDVDLLMEHGRPLGLIALLGIKTYLEEILGRSVDLGTALKDRVRESVEKDLIDVF